MGADWSSDSDDDPLIRFSVFAYDFQGVAEVPLTRQSDVEIAGLQLKQGGKQLCVIDIRAVPRIEIIPWTGMDSDAPALFRREPREREIV